jgi:hypothetical protein
MDVTEIRHRNLQLLTGQLIAKGKNKQQAAVDLDLSRSFHSQLMGGKKMGDDVARKIEVAQGLPRGWMDVLQPASGSLRIGESATVSYLPSQPAGRALETMALAAEVTRFWIDLHGLQGTVEDHIPLLALAHELVLESRGEATVLDLSKKLAARLREETSDDDERGSAAGSSGPSGAVRGKPAAGRKAKAKADRS